MARLLAWLFRFKTLRLAEWSLENATNDEIVCVSLFGSQLPLNVSRSITHRLLCLEGERFVQERFLLAELLSPGDSFIDVGANIGYLSLLFHHEIGPDGKLVCVEPDAANFQELERCFAGPKFRNTVLLNSAIGEMEKTVQLRPGLNGHVCDTGSVAVQQITLDSLSPWYPDFIKIDVEGYEGVVLAGAQNILSQQQPTLFLELHPTLVPRRQDVRQIVESLDVIYDSVEFYEYLTPSDRVSKLLMRFNVTPTISRIDDRELLFQRIDARERNQPFWAVCRASARVPGNNGKITKA